jgi:hypothetical protein
LRAFFLFDLLTLSASFFGAPALFFFARGLFRLLL